MTKAFQTKQIAGKIIPALATTTAVVAGLVSIEQYKMIGGENGKCLSTIPIDRFKNGENEIFWNNKKADHQ